MSRKPYLEAVRIIAAAAWADGEIAESEAKKIRSMIDVGPLDAGEKAAATAWLHSRPPDAVDAIARLTEPSRRDVFKSAVRIAAADGRTVRDERNFLSRLQEMLGLSEETAREIRDAVREESKKQAPRYARLNRLPIHTIDGELMSLSTYRGKAMLLVNVASECGLTKQYAKLQQLHETYGDQKFTVIGFPCNQFGGQEPGGPEEIKEFCSTRFSVTFPLMEKINVKGEKQNEIFKLLSEVPDVDEQAGEVAWNFEKFVVSADLETITRFRPQTEPDDPAVIAAIEAALPKKVFTPD